MRLSLRVLADPNRVKPQVRNLCLSHSCLSYKTRAEYESDHQKGHFGVNRVTRMKTIVDHPYETLFPWRSLKDFSQHLADTKVYFDGKLLAICKPWGVGTYNAIENITDKNSHLTKSMVNIVPNYSISDSLNHLCQILSVKKLKIVKTIPRYSSGILLLTTDQNTEARVDKALRRALALEIPTMTFWCVTKGWPVITGDLLRERVGVKLLELDEFGKMKHPIIINPDQLTNRMRRHRDPQPDGMTVKPALIELKLVGVNKDIGVSCAQLSTNVTRWNFVECYLAFKASFVLGNLISSTCLDLIHLKLINIGDTRFCHQVKHLMGSPVSVKPDKINFIEEVEPLSKKIRSMLSVKGNAHIPVLVHHKRIILPHYLNKKNKEDLVIDSTTLPDHFAWTLKTLGINCQ
jgi:hypothetical protein